MSEQQAGPARTREVICLLTALVVLLVACAPPPDLAERYAHLAELTGIVRVDGSSTVFPISEAMAEEFQLATRGQVRVTVGVSGTGGGFQKFCVRETDASGGSRPIARTEIDACQANDVDFIEVPIAFDGIAVVTSARNEFLDCVTVGELGRMWEPAAQGVVTHWSQIRPDWPDQRFRLYGPGPDSGTFDYFTEVVTGREKASRGDYTASEDDNMLVHGVANDVYALGYFGYSYYAENQDRLKLVAVDAETGAGCVAPSPQTISDGTYAPLARPIFLYINPASLDRSEVLEFVHFYLDPYHAQVLIPQVGYVPLPDQYYLLGWERVQAREAGTVFGGHSSQQVDLDELFQTTPALP